MVERFRSVLFLVFLACVGLLAYGLYLQHVENLEPCPLCILQRVAFMAVGLTALVAAIHNPMQAGRAVYGILLALFSVAGAGIAGRHVWTQRHPSVLECGPDLGYMISNFPIARSLPMIFRGGGDCAKVTWQFLGLSIPEWALIWFAIFAGIGLLYALGYLRQSGSAVRAAGRHR